MKRWVAIAALVAATLGARAQSADIPGGPCLARDTVHVRNFHDLGREIKTHDWARTGTTFAISSGLKLIVDHTLKHTVGETRPDGSDNHSFPSRHSSWAYGIAGLAIYNLAPYSPWWGVGAQFAANCVGMQRVMSRNHFPHDVMGGVGVAAATSLLSQVVGNLIFGYKTPFPCWRVCTNGISQSITVGTAISFPMQRSFGDCFLGNALVSDIRYALPVGPVVMLTARGEMRSSLVKVGDDPSQRSLNAASLCLGAMAHCNPGGGTFALDIKADAGYRLLNAPKSLSVGKSSFTANVGVAGSLMLTRTFAMGLEATYGGYGLNMAGTKRVVTEATVGFTTRASF